MRQAVRLIALAAAAGAIAPARSAQSTPALAGVRVFAVYEPVFNERDVELLARVRPDLVCRGWFKWHHTPDWQRFAPLARACRERGIQLQGGITLAAVYPGENGMDEATFRDFATHGTDGQPFHVRQPDGGGWYHLSLYNPKVVAYLKREARLQIDAGAAGIWYDEIEGYYDWNPTEGYDPHACAAFRDWLVRKYCDGHGWRDDDPRWQARFGIDLAAYGGSIRGFDYLRHLRTTPGRNGKPLADDPPQGHPRAWATSPNPLFREWGYAWDRQAAGTFRFDTVAARFADILSDADGYARDAHGRALVNTYNHNGTARPGVAFLQPHNGAQPPLRNGRLDGRASYLAYYEDLVADAAEVCPGQPVVFFVDWPGETDRLTALPRADQTHFFSLYIPEAYAAGGEFALPLRGYSYVAERQGTLACLARLADFYRAHAPFLRGSRARPPQPDVPERLTLRVRDSAAGAALHLVNHAFDTRAIWPLPRTNLCVSVPWAGSAPATAFAVSPDFPEQRPVPFTLADGRLALEVGTVACSLLVLLPEPHALRPVAGRAAEGTHILDPQGRALARVQGGRFTLWLPPGATEVECLETGERRPARDGAVFAAPPSGRLATGLLLDEFGIPRRHAPLAGGAFRTDAWGRYRIPAGRWAGEHPETFTAWQHSGSGGETVPDAPIKRLWLSDAAFDDADVDRLRAGHQPLPPPPVPGARLPLLRFAGPAPNAHANWDGKGVAGEQPLVTVARVAPDGGEPFLRVTFPAGACAWGNANLPLPVAALKGRAGLVLRLRATPAADLALALHGPGKSGGHAFFRADAEVGTTWSDTVLPWPAFKGDGQTVCEPERAPWLNLQLCRPAGQLRQALAIDLEGVDAYQEQPP